MKNLAASKSTVNLQNIRLNIRISCIKLSVELLLIWDPNYDGNSSHFIDMWHVNAVDVCVYPLLGLTASKKQLHCFQSMRKTRNYADGSRRRRLSFHCWQSRSKTYLSMLAGRCRRLSFHCWYSMSKTYLSMFAVGVFSNVDILAYFVQQFTTYSHKQTQNITLQMSLSIFIFITYYYRFKLLSFSTEMKDGSKQN